MSDKKVETDNLRLIHELDVHRIELEMQFEELKRSHAEMEAALHVYNSAPSGYFVLGPDGVIQQANLAGGNLLGMEQGKLIKRRFGIFVTEESRPVFNAFLERALASEEKQTCEVALLKNKNEHFWVQIEAASAKFGNKKTNQCYAVVIDITKRRQSEEALLESKKWYNDLFEMEADAILLIDNATGNIIDANSAAVELYGYDQDELLALRDADLTPELEKLKQNVHEDPPVIGQAVNIPLAYHRKKDGSIFPVEMSGRFFIKYGRTVRIVAIRDITERRNTERLSQQLAAIVESSRDAIFSKSLDGIVTSWNQGAQVMYGYEADEILGKSIAVIYPPENLSELNQMLERLQRGEHIETYETVRRHKNGTCINIELAVSPMINENGQVTNASVIARDITERKQAEKALQESEQRFRAIFNNTNDAIYIWRLGEDGTIARGAEVNDVACIRMGYSKEEFLDLSPVDINAGNISKQLPKMIAPLVAQGTMLSEFRHRTKDGRIIPVEISSRIVELMGERKIISLARDMTERKQAEAALAASQALYRILAENSSDAVSMINADGKVEYVSPAYTRRLGYDESDLLNIDIPNILQRLHADDRERIGLEIKRGRELKLPTSRYEYRAQAKSGGYIWLEDILRREFDENGNFVRTIVNSREVTERKKLEEVLKQSTQRFQALLSQSPSTGVIYRLIRDDAGNILDWEISEINELGAASIGLTMETAIGKRALALFGAETMAPYFEIARQVAASGQPQMFETHFEANDRYYLTSVFMVDSNHCANMSVDITERKQAEDEIHQLNNTLEQRVEERTHELLEAQEKIVRTEKLAVLGQMAGSVAHELRNPLGVIKSAVYYLKMVLPDVDEKIKHYHNLIEEEVRISDKIITDLLDFARVKSVERQTVSVSNLVHQTLERFPTPANVEVTLNIPTDLPQIFVDLRQMTQVLGNLTVNACQAMQDGGKLTVNSDQLTVDGEPSIIIAVKDTGVGITPENMKKLFEPLFTTKSKGIGLGLAVCKKLVEANGGKIEVESEAGVGSTFTIYLPVSK